MTSPIRESAFAVETLRATCRDATDRFHALHGADVERYRLVVTQSVQVHLERFQAELDRISLLRSVVDGPRDEVRLGIRRREELDEGLR